MKILHIASITDNKASGMSVAIPKHVKFQGYYAETALLNLNLNQLEEHSIRIFNLNNLNRQGISNLPNNFSRPDLVVLHGIYYIKFLRIYRYLRKNKIPYVLVPHGCLSKYAINKKKIKKKLALKLLFNKIINNCVSIQYLSEIEKEISFGDSKKNFISPNGIEINFNNKIYNLGRELNLIYIGRISILEKGLDLMIEAINLIQNIMRENNVKLNIYGSDVDDGKNILLSMCKKYKIEDIVKINDAIFDKKKIEVINNSDIFIQTSRTEGQPMGILEAMSYGLPIIATKGTSFADEIKENLCGWSCENNIEDIAMAIKKACDEKKYIECYGKNSREFVNRKYSWEIISREAIGEYKKLILKEESL